MLKSETGTRLDDESKVKCLLGNLKVLYREESAICPGSAEHEIPMTDYIGFFFKAYEASLRNARELGIVDSDYMESHVEMLRSIPPQKDDISILMRFTSELILMAEEYIEVVRSNADETMIPQQEKYALAEIIQEQPNRAYQEANERIEGKAPWNSGMGQGYRELSGRPRPSREPIE